MLQLFLVTVAWVTVYGQTNLIYDGGTISSYHVRQINQTFMRMHMVVQTGWKLGNSACGTTCSLKEVTYNNSQHARDKTGVKLGKWVVEVGHGTTFDTHDITGYVKDNGRSHVIAQNSQDGWELEVTEFDYDIDMKADYTDITLSGPKWRAYSREGVIASPETDLQIKLQPLIRNDTGLPNGTPFTIFRPVYRIPLNKVTTINLAPVDPDGDAVICEPAAYVSAGGIKSPKNITIHKDCRVEIAAMESLGYKDDGWDAIAVVMSDYNRKPIFMEANKVLKPYFRYLSQVSIQFMLHTVKTLDGPSFITPTPVDEHVFTTEVNSLLKFTLAAKGSSDVDTFHISSIPYANVALSKVDSKTGEVQWRPKHSDVGTYVMQVRATDVNGMETDERTFIVHVRDREPFTLLQHPTDSVFAFVPTIATFHCAEGETCIVAIPVVTSFKTTSVTGEGVVNLVDWHGPFASVPNTFRYQADVKLDGLSPGAYQLCLKIDDVSGTSPVQKKVCVSAEIDYKDPCESIPCMHYGECVASQGNYTCNCLATYTGALCEQVIDACNPSPCVNGKCYNMFSGPSPFYCQCASGFSGDKCDLGSSVAPQTTAAATPSVGAQSGSGTTSGTSQTCADLVGVNCNLLATNTQNFCSTPLAPKYCSNYCNIC